MCIRDVENFCWVLNMTAGLYLYIFLSLGELANSIYYNTLEVMTFVLMDIGERYITFYLVLCSLLLIDHLFLLLAMIIRSWHSMHVFVISMILLLICKFIYHIMILTDSDVRVEHNVTFWDCICGILMWGFFFHGTVVVNSHRKILSGAMEKQRRLNSLDGRITGFASSASVVNILV